MEHVFAISAYGESPYLESCIKSLKAQELPSKIIICTSTPSGFITALSAKYALKVYERAGKSSLMDDWNFCIEKAGELGAGLATVAHQDDIYLKGYTLALNEAYKKYPDMSLFCTRYGTIDAGGNRIKGTSEAVKRVLRLPLRVRSLSGRKLIKRLPLIFGNSICCPSCTYNLNQVGLPLFRTNDSFVTDWRMLIRLSGEPGRFITEERELLLYRIHPGAATKKNIEDNTRKREEGEVYRELWPAPLAAFFSKLMTASYRAYEG